MSSRPYYIYVPTLKGRSAGIRVLLKLGQLLNDLGYAVFIAVPAARQKCVTVQGIELPILNAELLLAHRLEGRLPIAIYPEIVVGNPLNAPTVIRYVLNWPGVLGGEACYAPEEIVYCYTETLCKHVAGASLLHIPVVDTSVFYEREARPRAGSCFYAGKYRMLGGVPTGIPPDSIEIFRDGPEAQTPEEIADLFSRCEVLYIFEDTLLFLEAALCGCASIYVPNAVFPLSFGQTEALFAPAVLGDANCMENARRNIGTSCSFYAGIYSASIPAVKAFACQTQGSQITRSLSNSCHLVVARPSGHFSLRFALMSIAMLFILRRSMWSFQVILRELSSMRLEIERRNPQGRGRFFRLRLRYAPLTPMFEDRLTIRLN